jgi:F-type H+-transporting ATPase subunit delta
MDYRIAARYAQSIFDLAIERQELNAVQQDLADLLASAKQSPDLKNLLKSPIIASNKKEAVLHQAFGKDMNPTTWAFIKLVIAKNRENQLLPIAEYFDVLYKTHTNVLTADLITATTATPELLAQINQIVATQTGKTVEIKQKIDPSLIGGYILKLGDKQIDTSIKKQLNNLRNEFDDNLYVKAY